MKKIIAIFMAALMVASLAGCAEQPAKDDEICPGKQPGVADQPPVRAEGFDPTVDMSFTTVDTNGNAVTNEVFAGTEKGVWLIFWKANNDKSESELKRMNDMLSTAEENSYKIVGIVMDGEENKNKAKEMTADLKFTNIIWNDEVASRFEGVTQFFSKEYYDENLEEYEKFEVVPDFGDPVFTYANSRGQIQTSCYLVPPSKEKIENMWKTINANATFEELEEQNKALLSK